MARMSNTESALAYAALEFIDAHGVDALTIRALGQAVDMHHTAVYRHYRSKDDLLRAVLAIVIGDALNNAGSLPDHPKERLIALVTGLRAALRAHPAVTSAYLLPVESLADSNASSQVQEVVITTLHELGLKGENLLVHYQLLESFALGASVFDFGGAPDHVESRRRRHRMVFDPDFAAMTQDSAMVQEITERAFELGLIVLVEQCAQAGAEQGASTAGSAHR